MSRYILGVHAGHNASVCIGDASRVLFAIQEERLTGEKNYWGYPRRAIRECLDYVGARAADLEAIAYGGQQVLCRYHSRDDVLNSYRRHTTLGGKLRQRLAMPLTMTLMPEYGQAELRDLLQADGLGSVPLRHHGHHLCHAATAHYGLRRTASEQSLVLTADGSGDTLSASVQVMGEGSVRDLAVTEWGDSLGNIYAWVTYALGFLPLEHEYKLMGMAPYASESAAVETARIFHEYLGFDDSGLGFQRKLRTRTNEIVARLFRDIRGKRFDYICAGLQQFTEDILVQWTRNAVKASGIGAVRAGGGVFMNVKANQRIAALPEVEDFEAFPSCGDESLAFGAYYLEAAARHGHAEVKPLEHFYWGRDLEDAEILSELAKYDFSYERCDDMPDRVTDLLISGKPVARCAGRMEFGARALGNRSILADPKNQDVVRVINQMVKKRDFWMPFAPMLREATQERYIVNPKRLRSPYMMMTFDTRENYRDLIAAVHNADLTCRAQILRPGQNAEMEQILETFERKTGRGVILNTSYNLHGFPIVRTPAEALYVFANSGLTHLQLGAYLVSKRES